MTIRVTNSVVINAPGGFVWDTVSDLQRHPEWMTDARTIRFETNQTRGVGTRMRVATAVGPIRVTDVMEVTAWNEGRGVTVRHSGVVSGEGTLRLDAVAGGTRVTWFETLRFPWYIGGPVTGLCALPVLTLLWNRNLQRLRDIIEREST